MTFDGRLTPARPDLAAAQLEGVVEAARYVEPQLMQVSVPVLNMHAAPQDRSLSSQLIFGERVHVYEFDQTSNQAWVQAMDCGYVGYVAAEGLTPAGAAPTHLVISMGSQTYLRPSLKLTPVQRLPWLARVHVTSQENGYAQLDSGVWVPSQHLVPLDARPQDPVTLAEALLGVPYVWGGRSHLGIDCSGLVQLTWHGSGRAMPRDSDMQADVGSAASGDLQRGDLILWKDHVGMMRDSETLLHATMYKMAVISEPLEQTIERIAGTPTGPIKAMRRTNP